MVRKLIERVKHAAEKGLVLRVFEAESSFGYVASIGRRLKPTNRRLFVPLTRDQLKEAVKAETYNTGGVRLMVNPAKKHIVLSHFIPFHPLMPVFSRGGVDFQPAPTTLNLGPAMLHAAVSHLASQPKYANYTIAHHEEGGTFGPGVADIAEEVGVDRNKSYKLTEYAETIKRKVK